MKTFVPCEKFPIDRRTSKEGNALQKVKGVIHS